MDEIGIKDAMADAPGLAEVLFLIALVLLLGAILKFQEALWPLRAG